MAWKNVQYDNGKYRTSEGGGGGSSTFADLEDVSFSNLQDGQVPKYNSTTQKWENANESGGGGTVTDVEVDGVSVVNQQGVAEIPAIPDGLHHYSTDEHIIGTWIDGKPLYEKVITGAFTSGATTLELNYNIGDGFVINFWGFLIPSDISTRRRPIGSNFGNNNSLVFNGYNMTSVTVKRADGQWWGNTPSVQVVIQYIKTTD